MEEPKLDERIQLAIDEFLLSENTTTEAKEALIRYAEARPNRANPDPIIPTEEIRIRLELIAKLEKMNGVSTTMFAPSPDGDFQFTLLQLSYLMLIPLECLRGFSQESDTSSHPYLGIDSYISFKCLEASRLMNKRSPKPHPAAVKVEAAEVEAADVEEVGVGAAMTASIPYGSNKMQKNATNVLPGMVQYASLQELPIPKFATLSLLRLLRVRKAYLSVVFISLP
ncbi:hypothetical protein THARTR1_10318 [Trichoderma harzianum]|uniref:Uncharacterized protein n=1 Tax=Trichoderma harzianum TaxID=5544 RepID=A0A2K0TSS1_TRIHA|nr:hypothetical protein THARTR1_10318 [Trichoderma harzianum]